MTNSGLLYPKNSGRFDSKTTVNGNDNEMSSTEDEDITITNLRAT